MSLLQIFYLIGTILLNKFIKRQPKSWSFFLLFLEKHSTRHPFSFIAMFLWPLCASCAISCHIKIKINFLHVLTICTISCSPCLMLFKCYLTSSHHHPVHFLLCLSNVINLITHVIFKGIFYYQWWILWLDWEKI